VQVIAQRLAIKPIHEVLANSWITAAPNIKLYKFILNRRAAWGSNTRRWVQSGYPNRGARCGAPQTWV